MSNVVVLHDGFFVGTMRKETADAKVLFVVMLYEAAKLGKASVGVVHGTPDFWAFLCGWEGEGDGGVARLEAALKSLMSPDPNSTSPEEEGRRVVAVDPGGQRNVYRIVNYEKHRELRQAYNKRGYDSERYQKKKAAGKESSLPLEEKKANFMDRWNDEPDSYVAAKKALTPELFKVWCDRTLHMPIAEARRLCDEEGL